MQFGALLTVARVDYYDPYRHPSYCSVVSEGGDESFVRSPRVALVFIGFNNMPGPTNVAGTGP